MGTKFRVSPQVKFGFLCNDFSETYSSWLALRGNSPYLISPKSVSKFGGTGKNILQP